MKYNICSLVTFYAKKIKSIEDKKIDKIKLKNLIQPIFVKKSKR